MKYAHAVKLRAIVDPSREDAVKQGILGLFERPPDVVREEEAVSFDVDSAEDFTGDELRFIRTSFEKTRNTNEVLDTLRSELSDGDRAMLAEQMDRLDEDLHFHIRLDLDSFLNGAYIVTESGDCLHVRIKVAAYPAKKERAVDVIHDILGVSEND